MASMAILPHHRCILVFAREPVMGKVKTRLNPHLSSEAVLRLYRCLVEDTLDTLRTCAAQVAVHFHPPDAEPIMHRWLGDDHVYVPQAGTHLGARMKNAFKWAFDCGYQQAVCVGTDIPDIHPAIMAKAFAALEHHDCTLGPAADGGYYLIGFAAGRMPASIFSDDINWGEADVFKTTMRRLSSTGRSIATLPTLDDLDTIDDVTAFYDRARKSGHWARRTIEAIAALGIDAPTRGFRRDDSY